MAFFSTFGRTLLFASLATNVVYAQSGFLHSSCDLAFKVLEAYPSSGRVILPWKFIAEENRGENVVRVTCSSDCSLIDWAQHKGRRVRIEQSDTVVFRGVSKRVATGKPSDQLVLDTQALSPPMRELAAELRAESLQHGAEIGVWLFISPQGRVVSSTRINSKDRREIDGDDISNSYNEAVAAIRAEGQSALFSEIVLLHTHPQSSPLSGKDIVVLEEIAGYYPSLTVRVAALSNTDPTLLFLKTRSPGHP